MADGELIDRQSPTATPGDGPSGGPPGFLADASPPPPAARVRSLLPDRPRVYLLLAVMAAVTAAGLVAEAGVSGGPFLGRYPAAVIVFAVATAFSVLIPVRQLVTSGGKLVINPTVTFSLSLMFLAPPMSASLVVAASIGAGSVVKGLPPRKTVFNAMNFAVSLMVGSTILHGLGAGAGLLGPGPPGARWYLVGPLAMVVAEVSEDLMTAVIVSLSSGRPLGSVIRFVMSRDALLSQLPFVLMAPPMVVVAQRTVVLIAPLIVGGFAICHLHQVADRRQESANHDPLTGLANRRAFMERLEELSDRPRQSAAAAVLLIDLDRFKAVNDTLGHEAGDQVLNEVGRRLQAACRPEDLVARLGGDEFAVLLSGDSGPDTVAGIAWRIHESVNRPMDLAPGLIDVGASVGAAMTDGHADRPDQLLHRADMAMYGAKRSGRGVEIAGCAPVQLPQGVDRPAGGVPGLTSL